MKRLRLLVRYSIRTVVLLLKLHRFLQATPTGQAIEAKALRRARSALVRIIVMVSAVKRTVQRRETHDRGPHADSKD
jgi:hypothetical protein